MPSLNYITIRKATLSLVIDTTVCVELLCHESILLALVEILFCKGKSNIYGAPVCLLGAQAGRSG